MHAYHLSVHSCRCDFLQSADVTSCYKNRHVVAKKRSNHRTENKLAQIQSIVHILSVQLQTAKNVCSAKVGETEDASTYKFKFAQVQRVLPNQGLK